MTNTTFKQGHDYYSTIIDTENRKHEKTYLDKVAKREQKERKKVDDSITLTKTELWYADRKKAENFPALRMLMTCNHTVADSVVDEIVSVWDTDYRKTSKGTNHSLTISNTQHFDDMLTNLSVMFVAKALRTATYGNSKHVRITGNQWQRKDVIGRTTGTETIDRNDSKFSVARDRQITSREFWDYVSECRIAIYELISKGVVCDIESLMRVRKYVYSAVNTAIKADQRKAVRFDSIDEYEQKNKNVAVRIQCDFENKDVFDKVRDTLKAGLNNNMHNVENILTYYDKCIVGNMTDSDCAKLLNVSPSTVSRNYKKAILNTLKKADLLKVLHG